MSLSKGSKFCTFKKKWYYIQNMYGLTKYIYGSLFKFMLNKYTL